MVNSDKFKKKRILAQIRNLTKVYPGVIAVDNVYMDFREGEIHGIIGKNGAGKTTLVSVFSGIIPPDKGEIIIRNKIFKKLSRIEAKSQGIDIVTQEPQIIPMNTVFENLYLPDFILKNNGSIDWEKIKMRTMKILKEVGLDIDINMRMNDLSISMQQLLAIIKSFYINNSPIIVLDESSASLSEFDREILFSIIRRKKEKKAIIYISHRTDEILNICDVVTVLRDGKRIKTESVINLDKEKISSLIIGNPKRLDFKINEKAPDLTKEQAKKKKILNLVNLKFVGKYENISLVVHQGEIVGLAGLRGSGRTEIMKAIAGIDPSYSGKIEINGKEVKFTKPYQACKERVVYLPEEREREGIIDILSVESNLSILVLKKLRNKFGMIIKYKERNLSEKLIKKFEIKCFNPEQEVKYLSGGNKQKVVLGKIYSDNPILYLLDEPTKGIDISTKMVILEIIKKELTKNAGIVMTTSGLEDLMKICDKIVILFEGKIIDEVYKKDFDERKIYLGMQGLVKNYEVTIGGN